MPSLSSLSYTAVPGVVAAGGCMFCLFTGMTVFSIIYGAPGGVDIYDRSLTQGLYTHPLILTGHRQVVDRLPKAPIQIPFFSFQTQLSFLFFSQAAAVLGVTVRKDNKMQPHARRLQQTCGSSPRKPQRSHRRPRGWRKRRRWRGGWCVCRCRVCAPLRIRPLARWRGTE